MALMTAHRGYVMETGRIVLEGDAHDLLKRDEIRKASAGRGAFARCRFSVFGCQNKGDC